MPGFSALADQENNDSTGGLHFVDKMSKSGNLVGLVTESDLDRQPSGSQAGK